MWAQGKKRFRRIRFKTAFFHLLYLSFVLDGLFVTPPFIRVEEVISWTDRFLTRNIWPKNRSLFMTNKFESKCFQKFYVSSKQEKECYWNTTSYLELTELPFLSALHAKNDTTFLAINLESLQKTTKLHFSCQVRKPFKLLTVPINPLRCFFFRSDKPVNCLVWKFCKDPFLNLRVIWSVN